MPVLIGLSPADAIKMTGPAAIKRHSAGSFLELNNPTIREYWDILWPWWQLDASTAQALVRVFTRRGLTLALAESCTGGLICDMITDVSGASRVLNGGVVTYTNQIKHKLLDIGLEALPGGGVTQDLTQLMADQVRNRLAADVGLAVTGVLGPGIPGPGLKVGQVYVAIALPSFRGAYLYSFSGDRRAIKKHAARASLNLALTAIARWDK